MPEEPVADIGFASGRNCNRPVFECDVTQIGAHRNNGGSGGRRPGLPGEIDAVVVKSKPGDRRGVPPVQIELFPVGMDQRGLEIAAVAHHIACNQPDAFGAKCIRQLA
jgi:hypothetical protein